MTFDQWYTGAIGRGMDPDGVYGFQCVDVAKDYSAAIFPGVHWRDSIGYGNAKDLYAGASTKYFDKIANNPHDLNQLPSRGDIIVWNATSTNPYGHIAVVVAADSKGVTVVEQDGFAPTKPAYQKVRLWGQKPCIGWLRPKLSVNVAPDQRVVASDGVNYREEPKTSAKIIKTFAAGEVLDLKGFVHGEVVEGNDVWFVGKHTGYYLWSGAFTDKSTSALQDLTPPPPASNTNQRTVGAGGVRYRKYPTTTADVIKSFAEGEVLDFDAFVRAEMVQGNDIWFRGKYTGGYAWSGGFTNAGTAGLPETAAPALPSTPNQPPISPTYSTRPSVANTLWGADYSKHQGDVDAGKLKTCIDFAIIKAGHTGLSYGGDANRTDSKFTQNRDGARQAGLPLAYYWYAYLDEDPEVEAARFAATVIDIVDGESLWLDLEENNPTTVDKVVWAGKFINKIESLTGGRPCHLYTYWSYAQSNPSLATLLTGSRKLWLAHYDKAPGSDLSGQPLGAPVMHQYTSKGSLYGINTAVDLNVFYGTLNDFKALGDITAEGLPLPLPTPEPTPTTPTAPTAPSLNEQIKALLKAIVDLLSKLFKKRS